MATPSASMASQTVRTDWSALACRLKARSAIGAKACDAQDTFIHENYAEVKTRRVFSTGVPAELANDMHGRASERNQ